MNEEIAKWCGFRFDDGKWYPPSKWKGIIYYDPYPDFTYSMDLCMKWAVPELRKRGMAVSIYISGNFDGCEVQIGKNYGQDELEYIGRNNSLSEAFCNALLKLIDGEK